MPYIFDIRDRYPNVLFDLNVISEDSFIGRKLSRSEEKCYKNSVLISSVTKGIDQELDSFQKPHVHIPNGFDGKIFDHQKYSKKIRFLGLYIMEDLADCTIWNHCERFLFESKN